AALGVDEATLAALDAIRPTLVNVATTNGTARPVAAPKPSGKGSASLSSFSWLFNTVNATGSTIVSMVTMPVTAGVAVATRTTQPTAAPKPSGSEPASPSFFSRVMGTVNATGSTIVSVVTWPFAAQPSSPAGPAEKMGNSAQPEQQEI